MTILKVKADSLNLRSSPEIKAGNIITSLPLAQSVEVITGNPTDRFWKVSTTVDGNNLTGYVSAAFLRQPTNDAKEALISAAVKEWLRFERGDRFENQDPQYKYVGEYWAKIGLGSLDGRNRDVPWSAAFISFIARAAGYNNFKFAAAHSTYVYDAVDKRRANDTTAPFWGFRIDKHKPQLGDLVCRWRENPIMSIDALPQGGFKSHCDVVVKFETQRFGHSVGNVGNSVSIDTYPLNSNGFLRQANNVYGVLGNNL
jgi:hypothetical protein